MDVTGLDINQCDRDNDDDDNLVIEKSQLREFSGTHKCHRESSVVRKNMSGGNAINVVKLLVQKPKLLNTQKLENFKN